MKINEVEAQVGITKKNIRFYEDQGLLKPHRNSQNGYREYMKTLDPARSLWIDVTDMDFIHNEADYREVLSRIQAAARRLG